MIMLTGFNYKSFNLVYPKFRGVYDAHSLFGKGENVTIIPKLNMRGQKSEVRRGRLLQRTVLALSWHGLELVGCWWSCR
jgi:hypothetical protein